MNNLSLTQSYRSKIDFPKDDVEMNILLEKLEPNDLLILFGKDNNNYVPLRLGYVENETSRTKEFLIKNKQQFEGYQHIKGEAELQILALKYEYSHYLDFSDTVFQKNMSLNSLEPKFIDLVIDGENLKFYYIGNVNITPNDASFRYEYNFNVKLSVPREHPKFPIKFDFSIHLPFDPKFDIVYNYPSLGKPMVDNICDQILKAEGLKTFDDF